MSFKDGFDFIYFEINFRDLDNCINTARRDFNFQIDMPLRTSIVQFLNGFKDSVYGCVKFFQRQKHLKESRKTSNSTSNKKNAEKLYKRLLESCILNGVFLLSCMLAFSFILLPILNFIYFKILSPEKHDLINTYLNPFLQLVFSFVWILPVFLLSKIFNLLWHQEIGK